MMFWNGSTLITCSWPGYTLTPPKPACDMNWHSCSISTCCQLQRVSDGPITLADVPKELDDGALLAVAVVALLLQRE